MTSDSLLGFAFASWTEVTFHSRMQIQIHERHGLLSFRVYKPILVSNQLKKDDVKVASQFLSWMNDGQVCIMIIPSLSPG